MTEREKMLAGELYDAEDPELAAMRDRCRAHTGQYNHTPHATSAQRQEILGQLLGAMGQRVQIEPPFFCDYGSHISVGDRVFMNFNCVILDCAQVTIGSDVLLGPGVQIYTATHPLDWQMRRTWKESARPITIGSDIWIGGGAILLPGITVGDRSVIAAGAVVTKNVLPGVVVAGNPARVIREVE